MSRADQPPVVIGWYSLIEGVRPPGAGVLQVPVVRRLPLRVLRALGQVPFTLGVLLFLASTKHPIIGVTREEPGSGTLLLLRALFGRRRKLVVFQFIVHERRHPLAPLLLRLDRWAVRRALLRGHALTRSDQALLAERYGLPAERFPYVPWPLSRETPDPLRPEPEEPLVLSAGRAYCDWPVLFAAAEGQGWPLVVVCDAKDRAEVDALNADGRARVLSEIPAEEFGALLRRATVSVATMREAGTSQGHIRIMDAMGAGVPVVATDTGSLAGYVDDEVNALVVPPADPEALRRAVGRMLADAELRARLREAAHGRAAGWRREEYFEALADLLHGRPIDLPPEAPDPARAPGAGGRGRC